MERLTHIAVKKALQYGGAEDEEWAEYTCPENDSHYSDKGGHKERSIANDPHRLAHWKKIIAKGIVATTLYFSSCAPPIESDANYYPLIDKITYEEEFKNDPSLIAHEEEHRRQFQEGGIPWLLKYQSNPVFRCQQEVDANIAGGYKNPMDHPFCEGIDENLIEK